MKVQPKKRSKKKISACYYLLKHTMVSVISEVGLAILMNDKRIFI